MSSTGAVRYALRKIHQSRSRGSMLPSITRGRSFHCPSLKLLPPASAAGAIGLSIAWPPVQPPHDFPALPWSSLPHHHLHGNSRRDKFTPPMINQAVMQHLNKQPRSSSNQSALDASRHMSALILCLRQTAVIRPVITPYFVHCMYGLPSHPP